MSDPHAPADAPAPPEAPAAPVPAPETPAAEALPVDALAAESPSAEAADAEAPSAEAPDAAAAAPAMSPAACGARLAELFPALFGPAGPPKPIKLRIHADLQQRAPGVFSRRVLGPFFARHTTTTAYLRALSTATHRFDLDGQPAGEVSEEHRAAATAELARRKAIVDARRAAERAAARPPRAAPAGAPAAPAEGEVPARRDARPARPERLERPARPDRPDRPGRPGRPERPARTEGPRPERRPERRPDARPDRRPSAAPAAARPAAPQVEPREPQDPAQRERAMLLRLFESSPLTKANFCALKRMAEPELDAQLALARQERDARRKG